MNIKTGGVFMNAFNIGTSVRILRGPWRDWIGRIISLYNPSPDLPDSRPVAQVRLATRDDCAEEATVPVMADNLAEVREENPQ